MKKRPPNTIPAPKTVPVVLLPDALLFPNVLLPLRIFEEHYRQALAYSLERERMLCVALMKPGVAAARTQHDFFKVAGLGLIRACVTQRNGISNLILQGLTRVELVDFVQQEPFWIARIRLRRSRVANLVEAEALSAKVAELCNALGEQGLQPPLSETKNLGYLMNPEALSDVVSHALIHDPFQRQDMLEQVHVTERLRKLIRLLNEQIC